MRDQEGDQTPENGEIERALSWALVRALERGDVELAKALAKQMDRCAALARYLAASETH